jgi:hypothetical protein
LALPGERDKELQMNCYTFSHGELESGVHVSERDGRKVIFGGEEGLGRRSFEVRMHNQHPPVISEDGLVKSAFPKHLSFGDGRGMVVLCKPRESKFRPKKAIVRIYTGSAPANTLGRWDVLESSTAAIAGSEVQFPQILAVGHGGSGKYARISRWNDGLLVVAPGNVISITCEDGSEHILANVDGRLDIISEMEYMRMYSSKTVVATTPEKGNGCGCGNCQCEDQTEEAQEDSEDNESPETLSDGFLEDTVIDLACQTQA